MNRKDKENRINRIAKSLSDESLDRLYAAAEGECEGDDDCDPPQQPPPVEPPPGGNP